MKFGMEKFRENEISKNAENMTDGNVPAEEINVNRRNFLRSGVAVAAATAAYAISGNTEAADHVFKGEIEYQSFKPSKHEEALIKAKLQALVPEAISVQITKNPPYSTGDKSLTTQNLKISIILKNGQEVSTSGVGAFYTTDNSHTTEMIRGLFERLKENVK